MMVVELAACHVLEDLVFPAPAKGYVVSFMAFYEQRFGMPSHRFLHLLLWHYGHVLEDRACVVLYDFPLQVVY
jgi:hypothetical protein